MPSPTQALSGIRVFDMTRVLAGPTCTQILGDLGADVIKIEQPHVGDVTRTWGPAYEVDADGNPTNESAYYRSCNRNKRSLTLNLASEKGQEIAKYLIAKSDVVVENFITGTTDKYGLDYETLRKKHTDLIYCSITGFGHTGPYAKRPGYDFQVQGMSGMMSMNGDPNHPPLRAGISIADLSTGNYAALAIMTSLFHRERTGQGQHIDMALLDSQMAILSFMAQSYLTSGETLPRTGNAHPSIVPYGSYKASDTHIIIAIASDDQFAHFCDVIGLLDVGKDPRFTHNPGRVEHRNILEPLIHRHIMQQPAAHWLDLFECHNIPCGPVNTIAEAFYDPQVQARHIATPMNRGSSIVANPLRLGVTPPSYTRSPPALGEHTDAILRDILGFTPPDLLQLRNDGII